ncbi:uncharacterized protein LOC141599022 [Silene latifolia]|uniref:uncharacterized protein LOC141599022 n=1 Tax=Silene latifolia TaxID=37657 RepID=UPI003D78AA80
MPQHHKTIRVIARNTKEIKHELLKYLKQGKVFEVGALLAIASDLIMSSSSTTDGENGSIGFKTIMEMRQFLLQEMSRSLIGASNTQLMEIKKTLRLLEIFDRVGDKLIPHMPMWDDNPSDSGIRVASLIENAAYDEEEEVEYDSDYDAVERYTPLPNNYIPVRDNYTTSPYNLGHRDYCTRSFSTHVHSPSWLEEGSSHVDVPLPLPAIVKGAMTKRGLSKKHASSIAKAIRHLRYR